MHWLVGLAMLTAACQAPAQPARTQAVGPLTQTATGESFSIRLPAGAALTHEPSRMDFETYQVVVDGRERAGVYVGNAPATQAWATETGPNPSETVRPDGGRERVWRTPCPRWPSHIHVWAARGPDDMALANQIVQSLAPADCPAQP